MPLPLVITVILNTNRRADTLACLEALQRSDYPNHEVIVLDNASCDGSAEAIRSAYPAVQVIRLSRNQGYAGNNNVGITAAMERGADWVLVVNEDVVLAPDALRQLMELAMARPQAGVVGPMVYHSDEPNVIQSAGGSLNRFWLSSHYGQNQLDRGQYAEPCTVEWISGCAILVRRQMIEQVGMLDERFFYYWEETEWCLRARKRGWQIWFAPRAKVWHKGVQRHYRPSANVTYYATRNWLLMLRIHHAPLLAWLFAYGWIGKHLIVWTMRHRREGLREHREALRQGLLDSVRQRWGVRPAR